MSFMKESTLVGFADLKYVFSLDKIPLFRNTRLVSKQVGEEQEGYLHLNNTAVCTDIQNLSTKLMRQISDAL